MCHFNHLRGAVTYRYSLENALGLAEIRGSLRIRCLRKIRSHSLANLGRGNYDGYGERKGEVTLQKKKKKKRNCGFPGVLNMREMRKTWETKVTQETGKRWHPRWTCGRGVGGRRACSGLGKWLWYTNTTMYEIASLWEASSIAQGAQRGALRCPRWVGWGDTCIRISDSCCCPAETNTAL